MKEPSSTLTFLETAIKNAYYENRGKFQNEFLAFLFPYEHGDEDEDDLLIVKSEWALELSWTAYELEKAFQHLLNEDNKKIFYHLLGRAATPCRGRWTSLKMVDAARTYYAKNFLAEEIRWRQNLARLHQFQDRHGHTCVPEHYADDPPFGLWVYTQRKDFKEGRLSKDRRRWLDEFVPGWKGEDCGPGALGDS
jgi:hypothetical protein